MLSTSTLPLTDSIRGVKGGLTTVICSLDIPDLHRFIEKGLKSLPDEPQARHINFFEALKLSKDELKETKIDWTYSSLWGSIPRIVLRDIPNLTGSYENRFIQNLRVSEQICIFKRTWLWANLGPSGKSKLLTLIRSRKLNYIRNLCSDINGIMISLLLSVPRDWCFDDTDKLMHSVASNVLFNRKSFLGSLKRVRKQFRKILLNHAGGVTMTVPRELSFLHRLKVFDNILNIQDEKERLEKGAIFCQTRASGLADSSYAEESVEKFRQTVTTNPQFGDLTFAQYSILNRFVDLKYEQRAHLGVHTSLNGNSCLESSRSKGGKYGFARNLNLEGQIKFDLVTGKPTKVLAENMGEKIFHQALGVIQGDYPDLYRSRIETIDEMGPKSRVVTSSSYYLTVVLQVVSHFFLEAFKGVPELNSGLSRAFHAWEYGKRISDEVPLMSWRYENHLCVSSDLETATDFFDRNLAKVLLAWLGRKYYMPTWLWSKVTELLLHDRIVEYHGQYFCTATNGIFMGDPMAKVLLTMANYLAIPAGNTLSSIIGDDLIIFIASKDIELLFSNYEHMRLKVSDSDTIVSQDYGFYTESIIRMKNLISLENIKRLNKWDEFPVYDIPNLKAVLPVCKNRWDSYQDTIPGKIEFIGRLMSYHGTAGDSRSLDFCNIIQNLTLCLHQRKEFVFSPKEKTGTGKLPPFRSYQIFLTWWLTQRRGAFKKRLLELPLLEGSFQRNFWRKSEDDPWKYQSIHIELPAEFENFRINLDGLPEQFLRDALPRLKGHMIPESVLKHTLMSHQFIESQFIEPQFEMDTEIVSKGSVTIPELESFFNDWVDKPWIFHRFETRYYSEEVFGVIGRIHPLSVDLGERTTVEKLDASLRRMTVPRDVRTLYEWMSNPLRLWENVPKVAISDDEAILFQLDELEDYTKDFVIITDDIQLCKAALRTKAAWYIKIYRLPIKDFTTVFNNNRLTVKRTWSFLTRKEVLVTLDDGNYYHAITGKYPVALSYEMTETLHGARLVNPRNNFPKCYLVR